MTVASLNLQTIRADNLRYGNLKRVVRARYDEMDLAQLHASHRRLVAQSDHDSRPALRREIDFIWWRIQILQLVQGIGG